MKSSQKSYNDISERCIFWNCSGFSNFKDIYNVVNTLDIICLYETWLVAPDVYITGNFQNFNYINVEAKKLLTTVEPVVVF